MVIDKKTANKLIKQLQKVPESVEPTPDRRYSRDYLISTSDMIALTGSNLRKFNAWENHGLIHHVGKKNDYFKEYDIDEMVVAVVLSEILKVKSDYNVARQALAMVRKGFEEGDILHIKGDGKVELSDEKKLSKLMVKESVFGIPLGPIAEKCRKFQDNLYMNDENWELVGST
jgi:hypothetical protein